METLSLTDGESFGCVKSQDFVVPPNELFLSGFLRILLSLQMS